MSTQTETPATAATTPATVVKSENAIGQKYDRFIANALKNTGIGLLTGTIASLILFKRRSWPIHYGIGISFGYSLKDFEITLNSKK